MRKNHRLILLVLLALVPACNFLTPRTYDLQRVHETYTEEWAAQAFPAASGNPALAAKGSFEKTLTAIRNYKAKYGSDSRVAAHLTVLEGMVYLQSGRPAMAKLVSEDVKAAAEKLKSSAGIATRDFLFAKSFDHLTAGWGAIAATGDDDNPHVPTADEFRNAADGLVRVLDAQKDSLAAGDVDSGAAYVANSAAIFYLWEQQLVRDAPVGPYALKGKQALEPYLTEREKTAVADGDFKDGGYAWGGRLRYLEWYDWLAKNAAPAPVPAPEPVAAPAGS